MAAFMSASQGSGKSEPRARKSGCIGATVFHWDVSDNSGARACVRNVWQEDIGSVSRVAEADSNSEGFASQGVSAAEASTTVVSKSAVLEAEETDVCISKFNERK